MFWHKMLIYYNNMYVLMYFTFEKRFMWFFSNRDHPCSFNVKNIIKKIPFADQLTWSHTIFKCYLVTFKIIPPPAGYSELLHKFSRYWTIFLEGVGSCSFWRLYMCTAAVSYNLQLIFNLFNLIIFLLCDWLIDCSFIDWFFFRKKYIMQIGGKTSTDHLKSGMQR